MSVSTKEYSNGEVTILWKSGLCIHSEKCVNGLPEVFNINSSPWINPSNADSAAIIEQVSKCPSGALSIKKEVKGEEMPEEKEAKVEITPTKNGPLMIVGDFEIVDSEGNSIATSKKTFLCRCGTSANKPFCDGSHKRVDFVG